MYLTNLMKENVLLDEECVQFCHDLFAKTLAIDSSEITYVENLVWWRKCWCCGRSNCWWLELATLVFVNLEEHPEGEIELKGDKYREMPLHIIDTGYGLERFVGPQQELLQYMRQYTLNS